MDKFPPDTKYKCQYCEAEGRSGQWVLLSKKDEHEKVVHHIGVKPDPNPENVVQFYSEHAQKLLKPQQLKVLKFLQEDCIQYEGGGVFVCKPLKDYNKTTYRITKDPIDEFECTCQYNKTTGEPCSHIGAVYEFLARGQKVKA